MFFKESRGDVSLPGSEFFEGQAGCNVQVTHLRMQLSRNTFTQDTAARRAHGAAACRDALRVSRCRGLGVRAAAPASGGAPLPRRTQCTRTAFNFDFDCKCKHAHAHAHAHTPPPRHTCTTTDGKSRMVQAHTCANTLELPNYWAALRAAAGDFLPRETFP